MQIQVKLQKTVKTTYLEGKEQETRSRETDVEVWN